jgi:hypothetical protein
MALATSIDHQDHRRAQQCGYVRGRPLGDGGVGLTDAPVEQSHHALDDHDIGAGAAVPVQRSDQLLPHQHGVEIAAGP